MTDVQEAKYTLLLHFTHNNFPHPIHDSTPLHPSHLVRFVMPPKRPPPKRPPPKATRARATTATAAVQVPRPPYAVTPAEARTLLAAIRIAADEESRDQVPRAQRNASMEAQRATRDGSTRTNPNSPRISTTQAHHPTPLVFDEADNDDYDDSDEYPPSGGIERHASTTTTCADHAPKPTSASRFDYIENMFRSGAIDQARRQFLHEKALDLPTPSLTTATTPAVTNNYTTPEAETRSTFIKTRNEGVGLYSAPCPSEDLRDWISDFPGSDDWISGEHEDKVAHYRLCSAHYRPIMRWVKKPSFAAPSPIHTPEPLLNEFRIFLGHMMALYYLTDLRGPCHMKIGGLASAFSCDPSLLVGCMTLMQNREGKDCISTSRVLQRERTSTRIPQSTQDVRPSTGCAKCKMAGRTSHNHTTAKCNLTPPSGWVDRATGKVWP